MDKPSPSSRGSNPHKNPCPICGEPKTPWSLKCQQCEGNRQLYLAAVQRADEDRQFLEDVRQRGQSTIAREMRISRQAVSQQVSKAKRRLDFLAQNPIPPLPYQQQTPVSV